MNCPDCQAPISVENLGPGDIAECNACGAEIEILQIDPLEFEKLVEEK